MLPERPEADEERILVRSLGLGLHPGQRTGVHGHPWAQLVYATEGVLTIRTGAGLWVVPSHRAAWVPPGFEHDVEATGAVRMRTLYLRPDLVLELSASCCVVSVSPLLRELVLETLRVGFLTDAIPERARLAAVLVDQLAGTREAPLDLRLPADPRARQVAERLRARPSEAAGLEELALGSGASVRTLERLFERETGLSFGRWRQRARLLRALQLLAGGEAVTTVALEVGYESPSAFIAMFKRALGTTPRKWVGERA